MRLTLFPKPRGNGAERPRPTPMPVALQAAHDALETVVGEFRTGTRTAQRAEVRVPIGLWAEIEAFLRGHGAESLADRFKAQAR